MMFSKVDLKWFGNALGSRSRQIYSPLFGIFAGVGEDIDGNYYTRNTEYWESYSSDDEETGV